MNKKLAIIENGIVINSIVWDDEQDFNATDNIIAIFHEQAGPGWTYDGTNFTQPEIIEEEI
jgi:hypothetical protein